MAFDSPYHWKHEAERILSEKLMRKTSIEKVISIQGGCINDCFELTTSVGKFFLKRNDAKAFPKMFECESKGLELLNEVVGGVAPGIIAGSDDGDEMLLILEWIEKGKSQPLFWDDFAHKLSLLHRHTHEKFGLDHDNYMGKLPQRNDVLEDWVSFFILHRIEPQLKKAIDEKSIEKEIHHSFEKLFAKLPEIFPPAKPSLLHGDLWSGNFMTGEDGWVRLIDPAVYYGHREMDLAMTRLFGGFDRSFYHHYHEYFPLESSFETRADVYNLYPLLIHVNLFGGHYAQEVNMIVRRFS